MKTIDLDEDQAVVLQQINDAEREDFAELAEELRFGRAYLAHILENLRHKGLIITKGPWIALSSKGKKAVKTLWPETPYIHYSF